MKKLAEFTGRTEKNVVVNPDYAMYAVAEDNTGFSCDFTKIGFPNEMYVHVKGSVKEVKKTLEDAANAQGPQTVMNISNGFETIRPLGIPNEIANETVKFTQALLNNLHKQLVFLDGFVKLNTFEIPRLTTGRDRVVDADRISHCLRDLLVATEPLSTTLIEQDRKDKHK